MTGSGFLVALRAFLDAQHAQGRSLNLRECLTLYNFVDYCVTMDALEDVVCGNDGAAQLLECARDENVEMT